MSTGSARKSVLFVLDVAVGSATAQVRGYRFREKFLAAGWAAEFVDVADESVDEIVQRAKRHAVVYLVKTRSLVLLRKIKRYTECATVYDLTDVLWEGAARGSFPDIELIVSEVDVVFIETAYVRGFAERHNEHVVSIPVCTLVEMFEETARTLGPRRDSTGVTIGWVGSPNTVRALEKLKPVLESVCERYPGTTLRFVGVGNHEFSHWRASVSAVPKYDEAGMIREILGFDIGIFPPPFSLGEYALRGAQKAMLYMTGGAVAVAQNAGDCARIISHESTGLLAVTAADWERMLVSLVGSPALRQRIAAAARPTMQAHSLEGVFRTLEENLLRAQMVKRTPVPLAKRALAHTEKFVRDAVYVASTKYTRAKRRVRSLARSLVS